MSSCAGKHSALSFTLKNVGLKGTEPFTPASSPGPFLPKDTNPWRCLVNKEISGLSQMSCVTCAVTGDRVLQRLMCSLVLLLLGFPGDLVLQRQLEEGAVQVRGRACGPLGVGRAGSCGGNRSRGPVVAGGSGAAAGKRRVGPAHLWQRCLSHGGGCLKSL